MVGLQTINSMAWTSKAATLLLLLSESTDMSCAQRAGPGTIERSLKNPTFMKGASSSDRRSRFDRRLPGGKSSTTTTSSEDCRDEDGRRTTCPPSQSPTVSPAPSVSPSSAPSGSPTNPVPSSSPSAQPSAGPSSAPSPAPSPSPSSSLAPSASPSAAPSPLPSSSPSNAPSESFAPTESIFSKVQDAEGFELSECTNLNQFNFVTSSRRVSSFVPFDYLIYLNETLDQTSVQDVVDDLEPKIHLYLAREVMTCDVLDTFALVGLSSAGEDVVNGLCSNQPNDPAEGTCWKVNANITTTFFFVSTRRRTQRQRILQDIDVVGPLAGWLTSVFSQLAEEDDDIYNIELDGFQALEALGGEEFAETQQDVGIGADQALSGNIPLATGGTDNLGFYVLVGIAGFALVVVLLIVVVRRNKRQRELIKQINNVEDLSLDESIKEDLKIKSGVYDVDRDEDDDMAGPPIELYEGVEVEDANHDYRTCASPTCYICKSSLRRPVFISTDMGGQRTDRKLHTQQGRQVADTQVL